MIRVSQICPWTPPSRAPPAANAIRVTHPIVGEAAKKMDCKKIFAAR